MKTPVPADINNETLFVWFMHRISEEFKDHAILKGGMVLRLLDCPRLTNDLDYTFVPYRSKKDIGPQLLAIAQEIVGAQVTADYHSTSYRLKIQHPSAKLQIEANVAAKCKSSVVSTQSLARRVGQLARPIRVVSLDVALANKLAAWNERRLPRDLYDLYFLAQVQRQTPDLEVLRQRLAKVESRIPRLKKRKKMSVDDLKKELTATADALVEQEIIEGLSGILEKSELQGLAGRIRTTIYQLITRF